jgi:hypothetical protein
MRKASISQQRGFAVKALPLLKITVFDTVLERILLFYEPLK